MCNTQQNFVIDRFNIPFIVLTNTSLTHPYRTVFWRHVLTSNLEGGVAHLLSTYYLSADCLEYLAILDAVEINWDIHCSPFKKWLGVIAVKFSGIYLNGQSERLFKIPSIWLWTILQMLMHDTLNSFNMILDWLDCTSFL